MSPEQLPDDPKTLWRKQPSEETVVTLDNLREWAEKFQSGVWRRNLREYFAALVVVVVFGSYLWRFPGWMTKTGSALSIVAALFVAWQLHKRGAARALPAHSGMPLVAFHREELIRQRDALRSVGRWYIGPFVPGCVLLLLGRYYQFHAANRTLAQDHQIILLGGVVVAVVFGLIWLLNVWAAERLQRKIDQLDSLR
jgi:hypothetical protein